MVRKVGGAATVTRDPAALRDATKLILPGVGAFDHGARQMQSLGLSEPFREKASSGTPVLGICVGAQLLGPGSEEGQLPGLGLVDVTMKRFVERPGVPLRIPHVGWNTVSVRKPNPLIPQGDDEERFYFTHSYHPVCSSQADVLATTEYGYEFAAAFGHGNVFGVQFHPEKSHRFGMALIRNFLSL